MLIMVIMLYVYSPAPTLNPDYSNSQKVFVSATSHSTLSHRTAIIRSSKNAILGVEVTLLLNRIYDHDKYLSDKLILRRVKPLLYLVQVPVINVDKAVAAATDTLSSAGGFVTAE